MRLGNQQCEYLMQNEVKKGFQISDLEEIHEKVPITQHLEIREYLEAVYQMLKSKRESYSYLQFAEDLGFSKTNVIYLIIRGRRNLSVKASVKIANSLKFKRDEKYYFRTLMEYYNSRSSEAREQLFKKLIGIKTRFVDADLSKIQLEFYNEWFHVVICEMTQLDNFKSDPNWIATNTTPNIRPEQARKSLDLLESLNLIKFDEKKGRHIPTKASLTTGDEIFSMAVVRYHQAMIQIAKDSITSIDEDVRDISSVTLSMPVEAMEQIKQEISTFRKKIVGISESFKNPGAVFQLNVQLFPVTSTEKPGKLKKSKYTERQTK